MTTVDFPNVTPNCSADAGTCTVDLASAAYTTGLLYTWNPYTKTGNGGKMDMSFAKYYDYSLANLNGATVTPTVTPYLKAEYGLFTPPSTPLIGKLTVFDLGAEYQNPISAPVTYNDPTLSMDIDSQGIITTFAQFIPGITKALSWQHQFQVYNDQIADLKWTVEL